MSKLEEMFGNQDIDLGGDLTKPKAKTKKEVDKTKTKEAYKALSESKKAKPGRKQKYENKEEMVKLASSVNVGAFEHAKRIAKIQGVPLRTIMCEYIQSWMDGTLELPPPAIYDNEEKKIRGFLVEPEFREAFIKKTDGLLQSQVLERIIEAIKRDFA